MPFALVESVRAWACPVLELWLGSERLGVPCPPWTLRGAGWALGLQPRSLYSAGSALPVLQEPPGPAPALLPACCPLAWALGPRPRSPCSPRSGAGPSCSLGDLVLLFLFQA